MVDGPAGPLWEVWWCVVVWCHVMSSWLLTWFHAFGHVTWHDTSLRWPSTPRGSQWFPMDPKGSHSTHSWVGEKGLPLSLHPHALAHFPPSPFVSLFLLLLLLLLLEWVVSVLISLFSLFGIHALGVVETVSLESLLSLLRLSWVSLESLSRIQGFWGYPLGFLGLHNVPHRVLHMVSHRVSIGRLPYPWIPTCLRWPSTPKALLRPRSTQPISSQRLST